MVGDFVKNQEEDLNVAGALRKCVSCSVIALDFAKKVSLITPEAAALLGTKVGKILHKPLTVLPAPLKKMFEQVFSTGNSSSTEIRMPRSDGDETNFLVNVSPLRDDQDNISGAVAILSDFTYAEKFEQNLARIQRLASIGTLSASMAHEIKNALVAVKTFVDLLVDREPEDELADLVKREMTRVDSIVSQILKFSGPAKPMLHPLKLHEVLQQSLRLAEDQMAKKEIKLEQTLAASDLVKGDDYQLKQVFLNLIFNALESMPLHGTLTVKTEMIGQAFDSPDSLREMEPPQLRVTIRDTGVGIPPENLGRVFEPFFTTKSKGTGLGLSITRRIIQEHRGTISVESKPGEGTAFHILFPVPQKIS